jgi:HNH endonuclease
MSYNPETGEFTRLVTVAYRAKKGMRAGSRMANGYRQISIDGHFYYEHRLVWFWMVGSWPEHEIDHVDRNKQNNRWSNLRLAPTGALQNANRGAQRNNRLGLRGVCQTSAGKYTAEIQIGGRSKRLGTFFSPEEASEAYSKAAIEAWGEFAPA